MNTKDNNAILKYIGSRLMHFRQMKDLTREEAAMKLGFTPRTIAAYERGEREITTESVIRMAELYGVTFTELTDYKNIIKDNEVLKYVPAPEL